MEFVPLLAMLALIKKVGDWLKQITNNDWNGVVTQLVIWVGAVVIVWLVSETDFAEGVGIGDTNLAAVNFASIVFVGLFIGSGASLVHDWFQSRDNSNSPTTTRLKLIPGAPDARASKRAA